MLTVGIMSSIKAGELRILGTELDSFFFVVMLHHQISTSENGWELNNESCKHPRMLFSITVRLEVSSWFVKQEFVQTGGYINICAAQFIFHLLHKLLDAIAEFLVGNFEFLWI